MGYLKEKYTRHYFYGSVDKDTSKAYGVAGFESFKQGQIDKRYRKFLRYIRLKDRTVLDIGFGRGEVVKCCAKKGAKKVVGIDFSREAVNIASEFNKGLGNVELIEMEAKDMTFQNRFDVVFVLDVIEHVPDGEMQVVYSKIYVALRDRGILILNTPFFASSDQKDHSDLVPAVSGIHCNKQTKVKLASDLTRHGFHRYDLHIWGKSKSTSLWFYVFIIGFKIRGYILGLPVAAEQFKGMLNGLRKRLLGQK